MTLAVLAPQLHISAALRLHPAPPYPPCATPAPAHVPLLRPRAGSVNYLSFSPSSSSRTRYWIGCLSWTSSPPCPLSDSCDQFLSDLLLDFAPPRPRSSTFRPPCISAPSVPPTFCVRRLSTPFCVRRLSTWRRLSTCCRPPAVCGACPHAGIASLDYYFLSITTLQLHPAALYSISHLDPFYFI